MGGPDYARLTYLGILIVVIVGSVLMTRRGELGKMAKQAGVWLFIFAAMIAAIGMWQDIRKTQPPGATLGTGLVEGDKIIIPKQADGHYYLSLEVNGHTLVFLVDTGASQIVLSQQDAKKLGFKDAELNYWMQAQTANGTVHMAPVQLDTITIGAVSAQNIQAVVNGGELRQSLLGMSYLNLFSNIEIKRDQMILTR
jgi:aspartyl protease family protein